MHSNLQHISWTPCIKKVKSNPIDNLWGKTSGIHIFLAAAGSRACSSVCATPKLEQDIHRAVQIHAANLLFCCRVISFEPVRLFRAFYEYSTSRNGVRGHIQLYPNVVSPDTTKEYSMVGQGGKVGQISQWGATRVGDLPGEDKGEGVSAVRGGDVLTWLLGTLQTLFSSG